MAEQHNDDKMHHPLRAENPDLEGVVKSAKLPYALDHVKALTDAIKDAQPVFFLDYDGTLTPITENPEDARLSREMAETLHRLQTKATVAVVSGRDLRVIKERVGIDGVYYAGSHGFEVENPDGQPIENHIGQNTKPALDAAARQLRKRLSAVDGVTFERKKYSMAIHYRSVPDAQIESVDAAVDAVLQEQDGLRKKAGKKVWELQPDIGWDKGNAVELILDSLPQDQADQRLPIYIGDDVTDEDAFDTLGANGIGIVVNAGEPKPTLARYRLTNPDQVRDFLDCMTDCLTHR